MKNRKVRYALRAHKKRRALGTAPLEWCALLLLALVPLAAAQTAPAAPEVRPPELHIKSHVLPNGLHILLVEDHAAPVTNLQVWYHVGSKEERPGRTGFAHLFEHLMFNGSENHNDEFMRPLLAAGATALNGNTWLDRTTYFENVPTNALDLALFL